MEQKRMKLSVKLALILASFVIGLLILIYGVSSKDYISISYTENNSIKYKVYLKPNQYFETPYLEENRTYIASLIDYIDIDYQYLINFNKPVSGKYQYYIKASIYANKPNGESGYYWYKDYQLTKPEEIDVENTQSYMINNNIKVKYDEYNKVLNSFRNEYSMQTNGQLQVSLIVESITQGEEYTDDIKVDSDLKLSIPLLQQTVEASIEKDAASKAKTLSMVDHSHRVIYISCMIIGVLIVSMALSAFIENIITIIRSSKRNLYRTQLNKILRNHDSIIATVTTLPDTTNLNVIKVASFEELLDVYNEVRMPINYYQSHHKLESIFIIINGDVAWIYKLSKEEVEDTKKV